MVLQERCNQTCFSVQPKIIFRSSWGLVTPRTPDKTPLLPAESHRRCPIPLRTASKACLWPHFINHTILSVTPLHASRSKHNPLASSKPTFLSAHALLTPSLHLKGENFTRKYFHAVKISVAKIPTTKISGAKIPYPILGQMRLALRWVLGYLLPGFLHPGHFPPGKFLSNQ